MSTVDLITAVRHGVCMAAGHERLDATDSAQLDVINKLWDIRIRGANLNISSEAEPGVRATMHRYIADYDRKNWRAKLSDVEKEHFAKVVNDPKVHWGEIPVKPLAHFVVSARNRDMEKLTIYGPSTFAEFPTERNEQRAAIALSIEANIVAWFTMRPMVSRDWAEVTFYLDSADLALNLYDIHIKNLMDDIETFSKNVAQAVFPNISVKA